MKAPAAMPTAITKVTKATLEMTRATAPSTIAQAIEMTKAAIATIMLVRVTTRAFLMEVPPFVLLFLLKILLIVCIKIVADFDDFVNTVYSNKIILYSVFYTLVVLFLFFESNF